MKPLNINRKFVALALLLVGALLVFFGQKESAHGLAAAVAPVIALTETEKAGLSEAEQKLALACKSIMHNMVEEAKKGNIPREDLATIFSGMLKEVKTEAGKSVVEQLQSLQEIAVKQGESLTAIAGKLAGSETGNKSVGQVLSEAKDELREIYSRGSGQKTFLIQMNQKGEFVAKPIDLTKAADSHATIDNVSGGGGTSAVSSAIAAASILRMGADAPIMDQYRNSQWLLNRCNLINAGMNMPFAIWFEEQARQGSSANVVEGGAKPKTQYAYTLRSSEYKKESVLVSFTNEFSLDFTRLESDILGKARIDLGNRINSAVLANVVANATAYNTAPAFHGGTPLTGANDYHAIAAMAAQVNSATFGGARANTAFMSSYKEMRMGTLVDNQGRWIDRPKVLDPIGFVGNPDLSADQILVGDFMQYNVLLRGGLIVRIGYGNNDFEQGKYSTVLEQFYFDYISELRKPAIVKGPDFASVKTALETA